MDDIRRARFRTWREDSLQEMVLPEMRREEWPGPLHGSDTFFAGRAVPGVVAEGPSAHARMLNEEERAVSFGRVKSTAVTAARLSSQNPKSRRLPRAGGTCPDVDAKKQLRETPLRPIASTTASFSWRLSTWAASVTRSRRDAVLATVHRSQANGQSAGSASPCGNRNSEDSRIAAGAGILLLLERRERI